LRNGSSGNYYIMLTLGSPSEQVLVLADV